MSDYDYSDDDAEYYEGMDMDDDDDMDAQDEGLPLIRANQDTVVTLDSYSRLQYIGR